MEVPLHPGSLPHQYHFSFSPWVTAILKSCPTANGSGQLGEFALGCPFLECSLLFSAYLNLIHA